MHYAKNKQCIMCHVSKCINMVFRQEVWLTIISFCWNTILRKFEFSEILTSIPLISYLNIRWYIEILIKSFWIAWKVFNNMRYYTLSSLVATIIQHNFFLLGKISTTEITKNNFWLIAWRQRRTIYPGWTPHILPNTIFVCLLVKMKKHSKFLENHLLQKAINEKHEEIELIDRQ